MISLLKPRRGAVQTITLDDGSEFSGHETMVQAVTTATYFCNLYCSGQRRNDENTDGLMRQYFAKGTDFQNVTDFELRKVGKKLNDRPQQRLGYRPRSRAPVPRFSV